MRIHISLNFGGTNKLILSGDGESVSFKDCKKSFTFLATQTTLNVFVFRLENINFKTKH